MTKQSNCHVSQLTPQYLNPAFDMSPQHSDCPNQVQDYQVYPHHHDIVNGLCQPIVVVF